MGIVTVVDVIWADPAPFSNGALHGLQQPPKASPGAAANKADAARHQVALYDAALAHLASHGALVNSVNPELLLDSQDFDRLADARGAAAAGDAAAEEALDAWADVEARFDELSARAWNTVVLQVSLCFVEEGLWLAHGAATRRVCNVGQCGRAAG